MSYILEALKKSEQERQQGTIPDLQTVHAATATSSPPPKSPLFITGAGLLITLLVVAAFTWYYFAPHTTVPAPQDGPTISLQATAPPQIATPRPDVPTASPPAPASPRNDPPPSPDIPREAPADALVSAQPEVVIEPAPLRPAPPPQKTIGVPQGRDTSIPLLEELSPSLRNAIPELHFAGHTYSSNPDRRMIIINNKILREGESIEKGLVLQEINWQGVILRYNNTSFQMPME